MQKNISPTMFSQAERFALVKRWESSGKTQAVFCEENNIKLNTFVHWRMCYLKSMYPQEKKAKKNLPINGFIPLKKTVSSIADNEVIVAKFSSGVVLSLPVSLSCEKIISLIRGIRE